MKKFNIFKIVQLSLLILITLISVYLLMQPEVKQYIFASTPATILFIIIWIILLASYVFLLIDFSILSSVKLNYHNLYGVAYSDPLSGIPNRFSCDTIIEKYYDTTLPVNLTCVMIDLSNLLSVNKLYDHATGNMLLKDLLEKLEYKVKYKIVTGEIMDKLNGKFPKTLPLSEQGKFIIGYYQQMQDLYKPNDTKTKEI